MEMKMNNKIRWPVVIATGLIIFLVLSYVFIKSSSSYRGGIGNNRFACSYNMKRIGRVLTRYALDHNGLYPDPNKWCDIILKNEDFNNEILRCPDDKTGPCSYAVNPDCNSFFSPSEIVLAFESKPGWNQHGGPELLNPDNHYARGSFVFFNDGFVRIIEPKDFNSLKWK
jgi:hypothetical protein